jgi:hypothetical protein
MYSARHLPEEVDLVAGKRAAFAARESFHANRADGDTVKGHHFMAEPGKHAANLTILALGQDELEHIGLALPAQESGPFGADFAFRKPDARSQLGNDLLVRGTRNEHSIQLLDAVARMSQAVREFPVIGQEHQSCAFLIEPTDGVNPFGNFGEEIDDTRPAGGVQVSRHVALGLIDGEINHRLEADWFPVNSDAGTGGVNPNAQLADDLSVN